VVVVRGIQPHYRIAIPAILILLCTAVSAQENSAPSPSIEFHPIDLWSDASSGSTFLQIDFPDGVQLASCRVETARGRLDFDSEALGENRRVEISPKDLGIDPWSLPRLGIPAQVVIDVSEEKSITREGKLRVLTAEESLQRRESAIDSATDDREKVEAIEAAARLSLELGWASRADRHLRSLRALAPRLAAVSPDLARRSSLVWSILGARVQRSYADADRVNRRAAEDRLDRIAEVVAENDQLRAERSILLAEGLLDQLAQVDNGARRRKLLDEARSFARVARTGTRSTETTYAAELLWARLSLARGWKTETQETLAAIPTEDPRILVRVATLLAVAAEREGDSEKQESELTRMREGLARIRSHVLLRRIDGGVVRHYRTSFEAELRRAAAISDPRRVLRAIEAMRPRDSGRAFDLEETLAKLDRSQSVLVLAATEELLISVHIHDDQISLASVPVVAGVAVERVFALLRSRGGDRASVAWFSERLFAPHGTELATDLVLVPFGLLRPIPYARLEIAGVPIGESRTLSTAADLHSATITPDLRRVTGPLVALVDPDLGRAKGGGTERPRLPSTRTETSVWAGSSHGYLRLVGRAATESQLHFAAPAANLIHLGCHGEFERHRPEASRLLLAPGDGEDGRLHAGELQNWDLSNCALVTLSGCETGLSRAEGGDDLAGFPRAVFEAGGTALLGSLWPVADVPAGNFFRAFHRELAKSGDPRSALHIARKDALADPERRAPRHWAGWVLVENFSPAADTNK